MQKQALVVDRISYVSELICSSCMQALAGEWSKPQQQCSMLHHVYFRLVFLMSHDAFAAVIPLQHEAVCCINGRPGWSAPTSASCACQSGLQRMLFVIAHIEQSSSQLILPSSRLLLACVVFVMQCVVMLPLIQHTTHQEQQTYNHRLTPSSHLESQATLNPLP